MTTQPSPSEHTPLLGTGTHGRITIIACSCGARFLRDDPDTEFAYHLAIISTGERAEDRPARMFKPDRIRVERGDWIRVSGDIECTICGCVYYDHAPVQGYPWLKRLCDGRLVKL